MRKHLREWHKVNTMDETLMTSLLSLVSSSSLKRRKSHCDVSATSSGPFREISNRLDEQGVRSPGMCSTVKSKSDTLGNILFVEKENQEKEGGLLVSIPPLPKTRSGSGSPGGFQAKPNRRRSLTEFVQKSPGRVRLKGSPVQQTKLTSEKRSSWNPSTTSSQDRPKKDINLDNEHQNKNTIHDMVVQKVDTKMSIDSPSTCLDAEETRKVSEGEEEDVEEEEEEEEKEEEEDGKDKDQHALEIQDQQVDDDKVKALIAQRRSM